MSRLYDTVVTSLLALATGVACASSEDIGSYGVGTGSGGGDASASGGSSVGSGGLSSSGNATGSGGVSSSGNATGSGGVSSSGNATGSGGASSSGNATGSGGVIATGGASSGGTTGTGGTSTGGTTGCADSDGDGIDDCTEDSDGNDWTDKTVFNGLHVQRANQCSNVGSCTENDTFSEVTSCMQTVLEEKDQSSGWDWQNPPDDICDPAYGFSPPWSGCDTTWAAEWNGCIHFTTAGPHCFQIAGGTSEGCAALYFNGNTTTADTQSGGSVACFNLTAGNYPLMFHYTMDNGSTSSMHVRYCDAAGSATCTPTNAIPATMLRTSCP